MIFVRAIQISSDLAIHREQGPQTWLKRKSGLKSSETQSDSCLLAKFLYGSGYKLNYYPFPQEK